MSYAQGVHSATITEYDCIWQLPIHKHLDERGLTINLDVKRNSNNSVILGKEFTIYPINTKVINPFLNNERAYSCKPYAFERTLDEDIYYSAMYDFSNLLDYTEGRLTRYLEYPSCSFGYESLDPFTYEDAYIKFYDKHHLFNKYRTSSDGYKHIPLILEFMKDERKVNISTKHGYYFNETTMEISDIYRSGFKYTEKFVLPYNFSTFEEDYEFSIEMIDIGGDKLDVIFPIGFGSNRNYFGLCSNSENCVIGGIVE